MPTFVFCPLIKDRARVSDEFMHITDWFPTLLKLAGGDPSTINDLDGIDQWTTITGEQKSQRNSMLINIDEVFGPESAIIGRHKLVRGKRAEFFFTKYNFCYSHVANFNYFVDVYNFYDYYGQNYNMYSPSYEPKEVMSSLAGQALKKLNVTDFAVPKDEQIFELRKKATVNCVQKVFYPKCTKKRSCVFDIIDDPCETTDISGERPEVRLKLKI